MYRSHRRYLVLLLASLLLVTLSAGVAFGNGTTTKQIGLVIYHSDGTVHTEIVTVPSEATTFDVLKAADISLVSHDSGWGPAVCAIDGDGCTDPSNCFCDPKHFWAYWHLKSDDTWETSSVGVGAYTPQDGSVEGFSWSGFDASWNPTVQPPVYTFDQIAGANEIPEPSTLFLFGSGLLGTAAYFRRRMAP